MGAEELERIEQQLRDIWRFDGAGALSKVVQIAYALLAEVRRLNRQRSGGDGE